MRDELEAYSRRRFLGNVTTGSMGVGLSHLLGSESIMAQNSASRHDALEAPGQASVANLLSGRGFAHGLVGIQTHA